jgi:hypothetical protein
MAKRAAARKQQPIIDDADVQRIADAFLDTKGSTASDEELVKYAEKAAVIAGRAWGVTSAWQREFAQKVKRRVQFALMARRSRTLSNPSPGPSGATGGVS